MIDLSKLSSAARSRCQIAISKAEIAFVRGAQDPDSEWPEDLRGERKYLERRQALALEFLCDVFFSISFEAANSEMLAEAIRSQIESWRAALCSEVFLEKWPKQYEDSSLWGQGEARMFAERARHWVETDKNWVTIQKHLLKLAEWEASDTGEDDDDETPKALLEAFRKSRHKNLSKERFAARMGIERSVFFDLQAGRPVSPDTYEKASQFTGIPVEKLKPAAHTD